MTTGAKAPPEHEESLWRLTVAPGLWAIHFLISYATVALWCGRLMGRGAPLGAARIAIAVYTAVALGGIAIVGWQGYRRHRLGGSDPPHDFDTAEDRHRFLGFATVLLAGLSFVATGYSALAAVFIGTCQ